MRGSFELNPRVTVISIPTEEGAEQFPTKFPFELSNGTSGKKNSVILCAESEKSRRSWIKPLQWITRFEDWNRSLPSGRLRRQTAAYGVIESGMSLRR